MAIAFQYNKTSLQSLEKNLKMRVRALPTLKNKESALRVEVKKAKDEIRGLDEQLEKSIAAYDQMLSLWGEFDTSLLHVDDVKMSVKKIAGVRVPVLDEIVYSTKPFCIQIQLLVDTVTSYLTKIVTLLTEEQVEDNLACTGIIGRIGITQLSVDVPDSLTLTV